MRTILRPALALALALGMAGPLHAQSGDGYLFDMPHGSLGLRGGWAFARAGGDLFDQLRQDHTLDTKDFSSLAFGVDVGLTVTERVDIALGLGYSRANKKSEMRGWIGEDDLPITQTTSYKRVPLTAGVKYYLVDRGRQIGRLAWVPETYLPWFGLGAGWIRYDLEQEGEFVTNITPESADIVQGYLEDAGWTPTFYLAGGLDVAVSPTVLLTGEGRYNFGSGEPGLDYDRFDGIDVSGLQTSVGLAFRF